MFCFVLYRSKIDKMRIEIENKKVYDNYLST